MNEIKRLQVELGVRSYPILIGEGLLARAGAEIRAETAARRAIVVSDENVAPLYLPAVERSLSDAGIEHASVVLPPGEQTKSFAELEQLVERILSLGVERSSLLVALGGGVIGDLTGFAAAVLLRGIDFVQLPTTLLAQVDSSVGGKTGIDTRLGKNLVGAFHQPRLVLADSDTLASLPRRERLAGYAEIVKYGLIDDPAFFTWLEGHGMHVVEGDPVAVQHAVTKSCASKAAIVADDERESGRRALLNLGHTFAHALEAETGYGSELLHGEAVAIGMVMAFDLSVQLGICPAEEAARVRRHLASVGLPTGLDWVPGRAWSPEHLLAHMKRDKKVVDGRITFVLARGVGRAFVASDVEPTTVAALLADAVAA